MGVILVPLPTILIDVLLQPRSRGDLDLLTTIYIAHAARVQRFSDAVGSDQLARLVLNVATTRLILTRADSDQEAAAGGVIQAFGQFVAGERIEVGIILFVIIVAIQFLVITYGATRIGSRRAFLVGRHAGSTDGHRCRLE